MKKPITKVYDLNDAAIMQYVEQILTKMAEHNDLFPDPVPELSSLESALSAFRLAATEAAYRDTRAVRIREGKRKELEALLRELVKYVDSMAHSDETIILASGFLSSKDAESYAGYMPIATGLRAEPQELHSCRIKLSAKRWQGARMYRFEYRKRGSIAWQLHFSSKSSCILSGLEQFQEYEFRVSYVGIHPEPNYSALVTSYVI